jgi:uncharacterized protein YjbJ (UPF0337 family)
MDKDRVKGAAKQVEGSAKEGLGKMSGDSSLRVKGTAKKAEGTIQKTFGKIKDALRKH